MSHHTQVVHEPASCDWAKLQRVRGVVEVAQVRRRSEERERIFLQGTERLVDRENDACRIDLRPGLREARSFADQEPHLVPRLIGRIHRGADHLWDGQEAEFCLDGVRQVGRGLEDLLGAGVHREETRLAVR